MPLLQSKNNTDGLLLTAAVIVIDRVLNGVCARLMAVTVAITEGFVVKLLQASKLTDHSSSIVSVVNQPTRVW